MIKNAKINIKIKNYAKFTKIYIIIAFFIFAIASVILLKISNNNYVYADEIDNDNTSQEVLDALESETNNQLSSLDFDELDAQLNQLGEEDFSLFGGLSFKEVVAKIIDGEFVADFGTIFFAIKNSIVSGIKHVFSILLVCVVLCLMFSIYKEMLSSNKLSFTNIIKLVFFLIVAFIILSVSTSVIKRAFAAVSNMQTQMNIIFPILLSLMAASGGAVSVKCYSPALGFMSQIVSNVFVYFLMPIFVFTLALNIAESVTDSRSFSGLKTFLTSLFKWTIGIVCTTFLSVLTIDGVVSGAADGISLKATKYAIKNYVPYLGGYVSDGFALFKASSVILKNAIGFASIILLLITTLSPVLSIAVLTICINLISAIASPIGGGEVSNLMQKFASSFKMLLAIVIGVALMYFYILSLTILTINFI